MSKSKKLNKKKVMKGGGTGLYDKGINDINYGKIQKKASRPPFNWKERTFWYFTSDKDRSDSGRLQYYDGDVLRGTYELDDFTYTVETETQDKMSLSLTNNTTKQILKLRAINATQVPILKSIKGKLDRVIQKNQNKQSTEENRRRQEEIDRAFATDVAAREKREADEKAERQAQEVKMKKAEQEKKSQEEQEKMRILNIQITTLSKNIEDKNAGDYSQIKSQINDIKETLSKLRETANGIITDEEFSGVDENIRELSVKAETFGHGSKFKIEGDMTVFKALRLLNIMELKDTNDEMIEVNEDKFSSFNEEVRAILEKNNKLISSKKQKIQMQNHPDKLYGQPPEVIKERTKYFDEANIAYRFLFPETVSLADQEADGGGKRKSHKHRRKTHKRHRTRKHRKPKSHKKRKSRSRKKRKSRMGRSPHKTRR